MPKKINVRAVYKDGSLTPLGPVDIAEGDVVSLTIEVEDKLTKEERRKRSMATAGAWADNSEYWEDFKQYIYERRSLGVEGLEGRGKALMPLQYLVDSDWAISYQRGVSSVVSALDSLRPQGVGLSIISVAELYEGAFHSMDPQAERLALRNFLADFEIVHLDEEICRIFGQQRGRLRVAGNLIGDMDILIGATALRYNLTLLTNNFRHFNRLDGLNIVSA